MCAHVEHGERAALARGEESVFDEVGMVESVWVSNPELGDNVLTQCIVH